MSKADNLKDFLTDVADAIRSKKGTTDLINPQNFSAEILALSGGLEVIEMTETTATIEPNKVYVWGMVESLDITLGASTGESDFFAFRFRCSKPTMTVVTINGATWAADTELDAQGKPVLDLGSWYQCEIKGGTSALYARLMHYIPFEDSNVEAVLLSKGIGDGLGVTYKDAAKVTSISTWFKDNTDITAFAEFVNFSGITQLIKDAFNGCTALTEIALPSSLTSIGNTAFNGCSSLTRAVNFENTQLTSISNQLFGYCSSLVEIILPAGVISISSSVFRGCSSLIEITLPAGVTSIGVYAFYDCKKLSRVINIENTQLTSIGDYAFNGCTALTEIALPSSLTSIGNHAFNGCSSLTRAVNFENTQLTSISNQLFGYCSSLVEIILPAGVTSIGDSAFSGCTSLAKIAFPASLTSIGGYVFNNCTSLAKIAFPASLTSIGDYAFKGCSLLQYIRIEATTPPTLASTNAIPSTIGAIYVPDESVAAYQAATNWSSFASKIKGISEMPAK